MPNSETANPRDPLFSAAWEASFCWNWNHKALLIHDHLAAYILLGYQYGEDSKNVLQPLCRSLSQSRAQWKAAKSFMSKSSCRNLAAKTSSTKTGGASKHKMAINKMEHMKSHQEKLCWTLGHGNSTAWQFSEKQPRFRLSDAFSRFHEGERCSTSMMHRMSCRNLEHTLEIGRVLLRV